MGTFRSHLQSPPGNARLKILESSIGTLSPLQWGLAGGAIIATIDKTFLDRTPITDTDNFASPAIEEELLQMMEP